VAVDGWSIQERQALRPLLPLPLGYLCLLIFSCMMMVLVLHWVAAGLGAFGVGWFMGQGINRIDPFAWGIMAKNLKLPQRLLP
jgi:hypothetical protein